MFLRHNFGKFAFIALVLTIFSSYEPLSKVGTEFEVNTDHDNEYIFSLVLYSEKSIKI